MIRQLLTRRARRRQVLADEAARYAAERRQFEREIRRRAYADFVTRSERTR